MNIIATKLLAIAFGWRKYIRLLLYGLIISTTLCLEQVNYAVSAGSPQIKKPASTGEASSSIVWYPNLSQAIDVAKKCHRWVLVDFHANWNTWCKKLDVTTYASPRVVNYLKSCFVCVRINVDDPNYVVRIRNYYSISFFPTVLILDPDGAVQGRIDGYLDANDFAERIVNITATAAQ